MLLDIQGALDEASEGGDCAEPDDDFTAVEDELRPNSISMNMDSEEGLLRRLLFDIDEECMVLN